MEILKTQQNQSSIGFSSKVKSIQPQDPLERKLRRRIRAYTRNANKKVVPGSINLSDNDRYQAHRASRSGIMEAIVDVLNRELTDQERAGLAKPIEGKRVQPDITVKIPLKVKRKLEGLFNRAIEGAVSDFTQMSTKRQNQAKSWLNTVVSLFKKGRKEHTTKRTERAKSLVKSVEYWKIGHHPLDGFSDSTLKVGDDGKLFYSTATPTA